ncbi:Dabb family protein [uncultured Eudoraea sp.]|uniref:Dabb family protein n=1 Tax=uncultured Eudoraea sp. TaxID=1035614 RepID=UPI0026088AE8|nr:Dabb family protein [uncultured Eudoraea sp.]
MKTKLLLITAVLGLVSLSFTSLKMDKKLIQTKTELQNTKDSVLRHVVLFKFKEETSEEQLDSFEEAFGALAGKIPQISDFEWGLNNSPEGLDKGFTHCFFISFKSEKDRAIYLPHPDHKAFVSLIGPSVDDVMVVDYWTK